VAPARGRPLATRVLSGLVLAAAALGCAWLGGWAWALLVGLVSAVLAWEWLGICSAGRSAAPGLAGVLAIVAPPVAVLLTVAAGAWVGLVVLLAAAAAVLGVCAMAGRQGAPWFGLGVVYVGLPCVAIVWLRERPEAGLETVAWVLALVWVTDVAAYAAGRSFGGAKLAPRVSPGKTWAGLGGGVAGAALVGALAGWWLGLPSVWPLVGLSAALAIVEQLGDLAESAVKRHFGVKDSSAIIPGHGGFLDRVDGLMAVAVAVAVLTLVGEGSVLRWQ
jgi:phosphatidate cytidylyltransferase